MKIMKWEKFNESNNNIVFELKITTQYIGVENNVILDDFTLSEYIEYKQGVLPKEIDEIFREKAIEAIGVYYEIEDEQLHVSTDYNGAEEYLDLDQDIDYDDDELFDMAFTEIGIEWVVVPANDYTKKKSENIILKNKYNI